MHKNEPSINKIQTITDIKIENMDVVWTSFVSICKGQIKLLIDCGAHASLLKSKCLGSNVIYNPQIKYSMVGINGPKSAIQTRGATFCNITVNNIKIKQQFQIAGEEIHLAYDGILGMDFLNTYKAIIDMENLKLSILLPINHNLYEYNERQMFEKSNSNIVKKQIKNKLMYFSNTEQKYINERIENRKMARVVAQINNLETLELENDTDPKEIKILPKCERQFTVLTSTPVLAKEKTLNCGLYMANTIISEQKNTVSVCNDSNCEITLPSLHIETEPMHNYIAYKINDMGKFSTFNQQKTTENRAQITNRAQRRRTGHRKEFNKQIQRRISFGWRRLNIFEGGRAPNICKAGHKSSQHKTV